MADVSELPYLLRPRTLRMAHEEGVLSNFPTETVRHKPGVSCDWVQISQKKSKSIELVAPDCGHVPFHEYVDAHSLNPEELWDEFVSHERCPRPVYSPEPLQVRMACGSASVGTGHY